MYYVCEAGTSTALVSAPDDYMGGSETDVSDVMEVVEEEEEEEEGGRTYDDYGSGAQMLSHEDRIELGTEAAVTTEKIQQASTTSTTNTSGLHNSEIICIRFFVFKWS